MDSNEIIKLQNYVKKRFDSANMDYKTFQEDLDETLTYEEQKKIYDEKLDKILPKEIPKLKREIGFSIQQIKQAQENAFREEQKKQEEEIQKKLDEEIEQIIKSKTSEELEKLYSVPKEYIKFVAKKRGEKGLLLFGASSLGKSHLVKDTLIKEGYREGVDYVFISGHITQLQFYIKLYQAKEKIVIFDDVNILENKANLNMLKGALNEYSNKVEYSTSKDIGVPKEFVFSGQVIILLNELPKNSENLKAIENRVLKFELKFTKEEIIKILYEIAKVDELDINKDVPKEERISLVNWINEVTNKSTLNLNIRLYQHIIRFYRYDKENWKKLSLEQIQTDRYAMLIIQGISKDDWVEETGLSVASYKRRKKELGLSRTWNSIHYQ